MTERKTIDLALQGGGAHGAFTWGVLDRILADDRLIIDGISGTSAGAMNAVALADGFAQGGGRPGARNALHRFWRAVSDASRYSPMQRSWLDRMLGRWSLDHSPGYLLLEMASRVISPYDVNPLDLNPLRDLVAAQVDFERVRSCEELRLFISATNVRTGRAKTFRSHEMNVDMVMASACLPQMFRAVEIDGEAYWDGGYLGNPVLFPLVEETDADDLIIIQINPQVRNELPRTATEIVNRLNEITFNASLIKEMNGVLLLKKLVDEERVDRKAYREMRLHLISAEDELRRLGVSSKLNGEWEFLCYLRDVGYRTAEQWLAENFDRLGKESTIPLAAVQIADKEEQLSEAAETALHPQPRKKTTPR